MLASLHRRMQRMCFDQTVGLRQRSQTGGATATEDLDPLPVRVFVDVRRRELGSAPPFFKASCCGHLKPGGASKGALLHRGDRRPTNEQPVNQGRDWVAG